MVNQNRIKYLVLFLTISLFLFLFILFIFQKSSAQQNCPPLNEYLVCPTTWWKYGTIPMASQSGCVLSPSPLFVSGGNVGVGKTNPGYKLDILGDVGAYAYYYTSDISLKKNIRKIDGNILEKILLLEPVKFNWKKDGKESIGLIAQDVEKVFPELVYTSANGEKSVDYGRLSVYLINAIKELKSEIDNCKSK